MLDQVRAVLGVAWTPKPRCSLPIVGCQTRAHPHQAHSREARTRCGPIVVALNERAGHGGGGSGIRTHGTLSGPATFKVAAFDRSATPPPAVYSPTWRAGLTDLASESTA
jgi:hypothetical protein